MIKKKKSPNIEFSVIAGELKGKRITAPDLGTTRPPLTRLRKAVFDFLTPHVQDEGYLDLFSGTGSYLFEAVSRGAAMAVGVEKERELVEAINRQAFELGIGGRLRCLREDVFAAIERIHTGPKRWKVIMMAPPQYLDLVHKTLIVLRRAPVSTDGGMIVCQHDTSETRKIDFLDFPILQQRKYGNTTFTVLSPGTTAANPETSGSGPV